MKEYTRCYLNITVPGHRFNPRNLKETYHRVIKEITTKLKKLNIEYEFCDTVPGWGNLNQDWLSFEADIETSWEWCSIKGLEYLINHFRAGSLLLMVSYIKVKENGEVEYIPHH